MKISFLAGDRFLQLVTVARGHSAFEQINGGFITLMEVGFGGAGGRDMTLLLDKFATKHEIWQSRR